MPDNRGRSKPNSRTAPERGIPTMWKKCTASNVLKAAVALTASGVALVTTCSSAELQAVVAGVEAAARSLDGNAHDDDLTFGEWLLEELDD